jgi:uncharacterized tellurite resistance protein B-like protein
MISASRGLSAFQESSMDQEVARRVCRLIAGIVVSDDDLAPKEDAFVDRMLERFGIPVSEREVVFPIIDESEAVEAMKSLDVEVQKEAFQLLVDAAAVDGSIEPEELSYLEAVAAIVEVSKDELAERLEQALKKASD